MLSSTTAASPELFQPVLTRQGRTIGWLRARSGWTVASSVVQSVLVALAATISTRVVEAERPVLVPVKIVRTAQPPPPPAAPPPAAKPVQPQQPPPKVTTVPRRAAAALVQPRELPDELKPPDPNEPIEEAWSGDAEGGVVGGVVGPIEPATAPVAIEKAPPPEKPVRFRSEMTPPVFVAGPPLEYTPQALEREIEGTMVVECVVDVAGKVHACRILRGLPFLDHAAIANLEQRRYRPATLEGRPLSVSYTFTLNFKLP